MKQVLPFFLVFFIVSTGWAQNQVVEGRVTASEDGQPLPGVNVIIQGTTKGTATDIDGRYHIELASDETTLNFTFIGYKTSTVVVGGKTTIDVVLEMDTKSLEEG